MKKTIKNVNDFVLAVLMLALSLFLLLCPNITSNIPSVSMGGYFTRPDVYIRMLALFLVVASLALLIRSLNLGKKAQQISGFHFTINSTVIMTVAALLLYCVLLPVVGFYICTAAILLFLNGLYVYKENNKKLKDYTKKELIKYTVIDVIYTGCMVVVLWLVFAKLLGVPPAVTVSFRRHLRENIRTKNRRELEERMKKLFALILAVVMTCSLAACGSQNDPSDNASDNYPSGPITCIVPYAAGGGSDVLTRTIMKYISLPNNASMVAVNVEGASGYTGCLQAAKSDPDGYTILAHNPMDVVGFTLSGSTTEELYKEMELICCVVNDYGVVMTNTATGWTSLDEMAA